MHSLRCKAGAAAEALCVSGKQADGERRAATLPKEVSGFRVLWQCLAVGPLLWRGVQEVAADIEWEDQEPAVQVHDHLLLGSKHRGQRRSQ